VPQTTRIYNRFEISGQELTNPEFIEKWKLNDKKKELGCKSTTFRSECKKVGVSKDQKKDSLPRRGRGRPKKVNAYKVQKKASRVDEEEKLNLEEYYTTLMNTFEDGIDENVIMYSLKESEIEKDESEENEEDNEVINNYIDRDIVEDEYIQAMKIHSKLNFTVNNAIDEKDDSNNDRDDDNSGDENSKKNNNKENNFKKKREKKLSSKMKEWMDSKDVLLGIEDFEVSVPRKRKREYDEPWYQNKRYMLDELKEDIFLENNMNK
jgi:hypothetical protein